MLSPHTTSTLKEYPGPLSPVWPASGGEGRDRNEDLTDCNTALFYSISSPQKGLTGIELGMSMIREVSKKIKDEFPTIDAFATLSPIPGFRDFLLDQIHEVMSGKSEKVANFATEIELMSLENWMIDQKSSVQFPSVWHLLHDVIKSNAWIHDDVLASKLEAPLVRKCAHYLFHEKKKDFAVNTVGEKHVFSSYSDHRCLLSLSCRLSVTMNLLSLSFPDAFVFVVQQQTKEKEFSLLINVCA